MNSIEQWLIGWSLGFASAHALQLALRFAPVLTGKAVNALLQVPAVREYVSKNPQQIKSILEAVEKEIEKDIDSVSSTQTPQA